MKSEIDIEKVTVSLFGGYMLSSLLSGMSISEIAKPNILVIVIKLIVCIGIIGAVTFKNIKNGKLVSFFALCIVNLSDKRLLVYERRNKRRIKKDKNCKYKIMSNINWIVYNYDCMWGRYSKI